jgi:hypothetical protein
MNTPRTLIAVSLVSLFAATGAVAQEATPTGFDQFMSVSSRAEVRSDAADAYRAGLIGGGEVSRSAVAFESTKTRAQVMAEAAEAQRLGLVGHGEVSAPSINPAQAEQIQMAGLRALGVPMAQAGR